MDAGGTATPLHDFDQTDGYGPQAGLIQAADGSLYGPTRGCDGFCSSASPHAGTIFRLVLPLSTAAAADSPTTIPEGQSVLLRAVPQGGSSTYTSYQWYRDGVEISGATDPTYEATAAGEYAVTVTDSDDTTSPPSAPI